MPLHPDCVAYMRKAGEWYAAQGYGAPWEMPAPRSRQAFREFILAGKPPLAEMASVENRTIPTRGGARPVRILTPAAAKSAKLPVLLYLFSGGYVIGGIDESEQEARRIAAETPAIVVQLGYRLAPEHRFPAAAEDAWDALTWLAANAAALGGDPARLMVAGCSAGGGLSAIVSRQAALAGGPTIALALLLCPWLDLTLSQPSIARYASGYDLDRAFLEWFVAAYAAEAGAARDARASPLLHPVPAGHAPTVILAAECDPLVDEARLYAKQLRAAGAAVTLCEAPGMVHAFNEITHLIPAGGPLLKPVAAAVRAAAGGSARDA